MKLTIELTPEQGYTLMDALELFSRIHMGQFEEIEYRLYLDTYDKDHKREKYDRKLAQSYLESAKSIIFASQCAGAYTGISGTNERSKIAWDIYQQLRHDISHFKFPNEPLESKGRSFDKPFITSKEPLPKITITEE